MKDYGLKLQPNIDFSSLLEKAEMTQLIQGPSTDYFTMKIFRYLTIIRKLVILL